MSLTKDQFNAFKNNVRLCSLTYKLYQAFHEQTMAIYGDDKYADLTVVVTACCLADQFRNVIGKLSPSKVMPISDIQNYVLDFSDAQFRAFKSDRTLNILSSNLTSILFSNYRYHLYGDYPKQDLQLMLYACKVADRFRTITKPKIQKVSNITD